MPGSVIVAGARTPIGKLSGALAGFSATDSGGFAIKAALERAGVAPDQVDYVFMGQVLQAGPGQITARQAAVKAGIPMTVPATTINKVCLSGLNTHPPRRPAHPGRRGRHRGRRRHGVDDPGAPPAARARGPATASATQTLVDSMMYDGLFCAFDVLRHGRRHREVHGGRRAASPASRQDAFAAAVARAGVGRHQGRAASPTRSSPSRCPSARATRSWSTPTRACAPARRAESPRRAAARVRRPTAPSPPATPARSPTAAPRSSSCRRPRPSALGVTPLGEVVGYGQVAGPDPSLLTQPSRAINAGARQGRQDGRRRRPVRAQRGVRRRRPRVDGRPRHHRRHRQRQRRRHRPRPPDRHVGHPPGAHAPARAASAAAAASAPPPSAAAAARATPCSCRACSRRTGTSRPDERAAVAESPIVGVIVRTRRGARSTIERQRWPLTTSTSSRSASVARRTARTTRRAAVELAVQVREPPGGDGQDDARPDHALDRLQRSDAPSAQRRVAPFDAGAVSSRAGIATSARSARIGGRPCRCDAAIASSGRAAPAATSGGSRGARRFIALAARVADAGDATSASLERAATAPAPVRRHGRGEPPRRLATPRPRGGPRAPGRG